MYREVDSPVDMKVEPIILDQVNNPLIVVQNVESLLDDVSISALGVVLDVLTVGFKCNYSGACKRIDLFFHDFLFQVASQSQSEDLLCALCLLCEVDFVLEAAHCISPDHVFSVGHHLPG